jgi:GT2 family glycosyltransferase
MNKISPSVSIITVNYNGEKHLDVCLSSLSCLNYPEDKLEVIMVDNGSTDGSVKFVDKNFPRVKIIKNEINNYCQANNLGIKRAKGRFIALINNDLKLDKDWLIELVSLIKDKNNIGAVTGKVLFFDGTLQAAGH